MLMMWFFSSTSTSGRRVRPHEMVGNVFRCLVPVLKNEPGTVISPLLNTGAQVRTVSV